MLVNVYPGSDNDIEYSSIVQRDIHRASMKRLGVFDQYHQIDDSLDPQWVETRIKVPQKYTKNWSPVVPPNAFLFDLIMEAFLGYHYKRSKGGELNIDTAAIMGGAVVAVLTSWADDDVKSIINYSQIESYLLSNCPIDEVAYENERKRVVGRLNDSFIFGLTQQESGSLNTDREDTSQFPGFQNYIRYHTSTNTNSLDYRHEASPYSTGDVDIFLQPC